MEDQRFLDTVNYPMLLLQRINEVYIAINHGRDGLTELGNLTSSLTDRIFTGKKIPNKKEERKFSVSEDINFITEELLLNINNVRNMKFPQHWSTKHKQFEIETQCQQLNSDATRRIINLIINRLDECGLLILKDKQVLTGGEGY